MHIESRIGKIEAPDEHIFKLLSDFNRLSNYVPDQKVSNFTCNTDSCSFEVEKMGHFGMQIIERQPNKLVKITGDDKMPFKFNLWIQLKQVADYDTRVKVTLKADLNPVLKMVAKKPLTTFVDTLVDKLEQIR